MKAARDGWAKRRIAPKYALVIAIVLTALVCAVNYMAVAFTLEPIKYDIKVGESSAYTINAPRAVVDSIATQALKDSARAGAQTVYAIDTDKAAQLYALAAAYFDSVTAVRARADELTGGTGESFTESGWNSQLTDGELEELCALCDPTIDVSELMSLLTAEPSDIQLLKSTVLPMLKTALNGGVTDEGLTSVRQAFVQELNSSMGLSDKMKALGAAITARYSAATCVEDREASALAREKAASEVEDIVIGRGELIVSEGDPVTASQYAILSELNLINDGETSTLKTGLLIYMAVVYAVFFAYIATFEREMLFSVKNMLILSVMLLLSVLLSWLLMALDVNISATLIAVMLIAVLVRSRTAVAVSGLLALSVGVMYGGASTLFSFDAVVMSASILVSGTVSVMALTRTEKRGAMIAAGLLGGAAAAVAMLGLYIMAGEPVKDVLIDIGWTLGGSVLSAILVVGSLTIWERLFDVATPARLNELLNANQPLLKQLMLEAPGTYQHSVAVGALAEGATERIGADAVLAKVGAYYHDVGKLRRPHYFKENQKGGNIHDTLPPLDSATAIIAHQRDGVAILEKAKLPAAVVRIASEHHGNSLMTYFYYKAVELYGKDTVDIKQYRYSGGRPSTKESAIVMLADSCEAAVRSLGDCTREQMEDMVHKVMFGKMKEGDNMLSRAPLTIAELFEIEKSFIKTLGGLMHERIEYPDMESAT